MQQKKRWAITVGAAILDKITSTHGVLAEYSCGGLPSTDTRSSSKRERKDPDAAGVLWNSCASQGKL